MYKTYISMKLSVTIALLAASLLASGTAMAGKGYGKPGDITLWEAVEATPRFSALKTAIECFDDTNGDNPLVDLLNGGRNFTVFAPNNDAFGTDTYPCPGDTEGAEALFIILAYHVKNGRHFANSVFNSNRSRMLKMFSGDAIMTHPDFSIEDLAEQEIGLPEGGLVNAKFSNGVVHEIDTVMLPFSSEE